MIKIKNLKQWLLNKDRVIEKLQNKVIEKDVIENKLRCARVKLHFWLTILEMVTIPLLVVVRPGDGG